MKNQQENTDLDGLRKGSEAAFDEIFNYYFPKLMNFAIGYVKDTEVAREIVQDTFLKLWEMRKNLAPETRLAPLLYTITRNDALNYLKQLIHKQKYIENRKQMYENQLNYIALKDESSERLIYNELYEEINKAIADLPEKCRQVFQLSRDEGLKYHEIAEKMKISVKTVETHISDALKRLREALNAFL